MPLLPTALLVPEFHHHKLHPKFSVAKGKVCKKTWPGILALCAPPPLVLGHYLHRSEPHVAAGNAKSPREIFSDLSQMWVLLNLSPHRT